MSSLSLLLLWIPFAIQSDPAALSRAAASELATSEYPALYARFTPQMQMALSEEALPMLAAQLFAGAGEFEGIEGEPACQAVQGLSACVVPLGFEASVVSLRIAIDGEGRVAGLFLVGTTPREE